MSFSKSLEHLRYAVEYPQPGIRAEMVMVRKHDLRELLWHFDRLDDAARRRHFEDHPECYPPTYAIQTPKSPLKDNI